MRKTCIFIILVVLLSGFFPLGARALTISPPKFEFSADPGDTITGSITLISTEGREMTLYPSFSRVEVVGEWGEPKFTYETTDLASWIKISSSKVVLVPNEQKAVPFTIEVPKEAEPGGHYAAIFWGTAPPVKEGSGIGISSRIAILVLLDVSGEAVEAGKLRQFSANKRVFSHLPVEFSYTLENIGTVHLKPQGKIVIKNIFGKEKAVLGANPDGSNALPNAKRTISVSWQPKTAIEEDDTKGFFSELKREKADFAFGYYRANLSVEFGKKPMTAQAGFGFWIFPWRIIFLSFLALIIFVGVMTILVKRYNRWIIRKARQSRK